MNPLLVFGTGTGPTLDVSGITSTVTAQGVIDIIETVFPLVAIAILVGCVFYVIRWAISLFRGI